MQSPAETSLIADRNPNRLGKYLGRLLGFAYRLAGRDHYDNFRIERVGDLPILVLPSVANPKILRTGAYFALRLDEKTIPKRAEVLDLGTGSGVCALHAARHARRVVATDINPVAVRCTHINAMMNELDSRIEPRQGDLFLPVAGERFDLVLFNPPFLLGTPKDDRDAAWRSIDVAHRFAAGLENCLKPGGSALVLLSSFGDACTLFESQLKLRGFGLSVFARRRLINETITILRATPQRAGC